MNNVRKGSIGEVNKKGKKNIVYLERIYKPELSFIIFIKAIQVKMYFLSWKNG